MTRLEAWFKLSRVCMRGQRLTGQPWSFHVFGTGPRGEEVDITITGATLPECEVLLEKMLLKDKELDDMLSKMIG